jgi:hypothetical protein
MEDFATSGEASVLSFCFTSLAVIFLVLQRPKHPQRQQKISVWQKSSPLMTLLEIAVA